MIDYIVPFLIVLTVLVFVHELGHYLVARYNGVEVEVFSIGFGPELFGWTDKSKTRWKFSLIPLGGYVRMYGDQDEASSPDAKALAQMTPQEKAKSLHHKSVWARMAVSAAGPAANYLLAFVIFAGLYAGVGKPYIEPIIGKIVAASAAQKADLQVGDKILSVDGKPVSQFNEIILQVQKNTQKDPMPPVALKVQRGAEVIELTLTPERQTTTDVFGQESTRAILGIGAGTTAYYPLPVFSAITAAAGELWTFSTQTLAGIWQMIIGQRGAKELGGVLRIAQLSGDVYAQGLLPLLNFMAVLSLSLGLINLFPIPMLDGGHIIIYLAEAIRGKPLPDRLVEIAFKVGFCLVVALMVFALWNDITQMKVLDFILKWFK